LIQVAKNRALDAIRREASLAAKIPELLRAFPEQIQLPNSREDLFADDQLAMIFLCSHPLLSRETRVPFTLKTVAGFNVREIACAFLAREATIAQRLVRAKRQVREEAIAFEMPEGAELAARLDSVLEVLYLIFNEGYAAHHGESLLRADLCEEAIRLARLVAGHAATDRSKSHAALALMLLQASRLPARIDDDGDLFLLQDQDRTKWDRRLISEGMHHLDRCAEGDEISTYHLQAGIAAEHAVAPAYTATDWQHVTDLYESLYALDRSPVVALNHAIALSRWKGPRAGLNALAGSNMIWC
jgi:RNA polymerase sigma-70 factor (ECF subfamily)